MRTPAHAERATSASMFLMSMLLILRWVAFMIGAHPNRHALLLRGDIDAD